MYHRCCLSPKQARTDVFTGTSVVEQDGVDKKPSGDHSSNVGELGFVCPPNPVDIDFVSPPPNLEIEPNTHDCKNSIDDKDIILAGFDVQSLYPSLRDIDVACLVRESVIHSDIVFDGFDMQKALCYLRIVAGEEILRLAGLSRLIPRWLGERVNSLRVTGETGKNMENWAHSASEPTIFEQKVILGLLMEVGILISMGTHCYEFAGRFFLQLLGGPIGLALTAWAASLTLKCFDNLWIGILIDNKIDFLAYLRYVDDSRTFLKKLRRGVHWKNGKFVYEHSQEIFDNEKNLPDDRRITNILLDAMNSVMDFLTFTGESPSDFDNGRLPTLDCSIFSQGGRIRHVFFEKSMRTDKCLDANTALSQQSLRSSLRQEIVRRLLNTDLETPISEVVVILDNFYVKMAKSGHPHDQIRVLFVEAILKFENMVKKANLDPSDPNFKPLYMSNSYDRVNRGIRKFLRSFNWYDPDSSYSDHSWKSEVPKNLYFSQKMGRKAKFGKKSVSRPTTVLFVPNSNRGVLLDRLEQIEP